ncbi:MAG: short-chain dehydrogenase [Rhodospirillaceae bacterium]|nr:short-chain dehydrogenase [Rhodospirillaceae bacterium]
MAGGTAVVVGVGPGLGAALCRRFAAEGMTVAAVSRRGDPALVPEARAYACDSTDEAAVESTFSKIEADIGSPGLVVYNAGAFVRGKVTETSAETFRRNWETGCFGGFLVGSRAARAMLAAGKGGSIIFTGATASLRGGAGFVNLAVGKFGLRALAQSMARELGPEGIHVAHVIIDGQILSERYAQLAAERPQDGLLDPEAIAASYWHLHTQHRSAWTHELDVRPWVERF